MFRPRGALSRSVYDKIYKDRDLELMDKYKWYAINEETLKDLSNEAWRKFEPLGLDQETQSFLDKSIEISDNICLQLWLTVASSFLSVFIATTSVNGFLNRGSMFVFSPAQFRKLMGLDEGLVLESLLDIGAGDGSTTLQMRNSFTHIYVTEMSRTMKWSLSRKGFTVLDEDSWTQEDTKFDVVTCLNVLDRADKPLTLLRKIKDVLKKNGIAIISFVLPFKPYVEFGPKDENGKITNKPSEDMLISENGNFEKETVNFIEHVLKPNGWELIRWTKLPYLCEGDINQAYYWLDDAVFVIKSNEDLEFGECRRD